MKQYGFYVDSSRCSGCKTCQVSCKDNKDLDVGPKFRRVYDGLAPIFPYTFYHLTHYWFAAADIPVANDTPVHYADAIRCNVRRPPQGSLPLLTRRVSA